MGHLLLIVIVLCAVTQMALVVDDHSFALLLRGASTSEVAV